MSWRIIVISQRCKLDYSMNYMVVRGQETKRVLLDEIALLMLENNAVSMTGCLLSALIEKKIRVILCDGKRSPQAELVPYYGAHNDALKIRQQLAWEEDTILQVWSSIVKEKILNQAKCLMLAKKEDAAALLKQYADNVLPGDQTNREGHAAKVYFNALFGMSFSRRDEGDVKNAALDYGYALILSAFNREVVMNGYLTQLGLAHNNQFNHYNLSCDLMEPFRPYVDLAVYTDEWKDFGPEEKHKMINLLNSSVKIRCTEQTMLNAIKIYTKSVFDALCEDNAALIKFTEI